MSLELVGAIGTHNTSEYRPGKAGPIVDKTFVSAFARAHEYAGFDRVLIGYFSSSPDGFQVAAYAGQHWARAGRIWEALKASGVERRSSIFRVAGQPPQKLIPRVREASRSRTIAHSA